MLQAITGQTKDPQEIIPPRQLSRLIGDLSLATIWRMRQRGEFPAPIRLGPRRVGYLRSEIDTWLANRARAPR
jgi:prophage regulatory protein